MKYRKDQDGTYIDYEVDGYIDIPGWKIAWFLIRLAIVIIGGTWLFCWFVWG